MQPVDLCYNPINERVYSANRLTYNLTVIKDTLLVVDPPPVNGSPLVCFPNPTNGVININRGVVIRLYSAVGELLFTSSAPVNRLDISFLPAGIYFLKTDQGVFRLFRL